MSYSAPVPVFYSHVIYSGDLTVTTSRYYSVGSLTWALADRAIYVPVRISAPIVVKKLGIMNGADVGATLDLGIYDAAGTKLVSTGAQSQGSGSTMVIFDVTDTVIQMGLCYFAVVLSNNTSSVMGYNRTAPISLSNGVLTEALGSTALPATATWAANQTNTFSPFVFAFLDPTAA